MHERALSHPLIREAAVTPFSHTLVHRLRRRPRVLVALVATLALSGAGVVTAVQAQAAVDYTQGVTQLNATQAKIWFTPTVPSTLVDVHYTFPGQSQQDFRMTNNGGTWEKTILQQLATGTVVTYWFTFNKNGANQADTPHFTYTHGGGTNPPPPPPPGPPPPPPSGGSCATADYTCGVTTVSASQSKVSFKPTITSTLVDLHFVPAGQSQQDFRMTNNAGTWEWTVGGLAGGQVVAYWFTFNKNGANQADTVHYTFTQGGGCTTDCGGGGNQVATPVLSTEPGVYNGGVAVYLTDATPGAVIHYALGGATPTAASPVAGGPISITTTQTLKVIATKAGMTNSAVAGGLYTVGTGSCGTTCGGGGTGTFPLVLTNNTGGTWNSNQIYFTVIGQAVEGQWSYLKPNGTWTHINFADTDAPGHLTKRGVNYPNMSFTMAQAGRVNVPTSTRGGRIYVSIGSPVYIPVSKDNAGWGGPDLRNDKDPNLDVIFDWYEFTYIFGQVAYGGNTTQVDMFSFPMTVRLQQASSGYDSTLGMTQTRAQVMSGYQAAVGPAYRGQVNRFRIVAPRTSSDFQPGGAQGNLMQAYIDQVWSKFTAQPWSEVHDGRTYRGQISGGVLTGTKDDGTPFHVAKPTSTQVFECSGPLALPNEQGGSDVIREVGRDFCAAFNRGVALNPADWYNPAKYYVTAPYNDYAKYLHQISLGGKAYAFAYDDVNNQSSVQILGNNNPPTALTLAIGW
jgi:hypothetical protein